MALTGATSPSLVYVTPHHPPALQNHSDPSPSVPAAFYIYLHERIIPSVVNYLSDVFAQETELLTAHTVNIW